MCLVCVCKKEEHKRDGLKEEKAACQIRCSNECVALCTVQMGDDVRCVGLEPMCVSHTVC